MGTAPFARDASVVAVGDDVVMGDQMGHELRVVDLGGTLRRIVRWNGPSLEVTPEEVAAWKNAQVAAADPRDRAGVRTYLEGTPLPERRPAYADYVRRTNAFLPGPARKPS